MSTIPPKSDDGTAAVAFVECSDEATTTVEQCVLYAEYCMVWNHTSMSLFYSADLLMLL